MLALVLAISLSQAPADAPAVREKRVLPLQVDLGLVAGLANRAAAGFALYVGLATGPARPPWGTPFGGVGFEYVQQLGRVPFRASYGVQVRGGYAWSSDDELRDDLTPDVFVFGRVTPFVGTNVGFGDGQLPPDDSDAPGPTTAVFGVRLGVGATVPWVTRQLLFQRPFADQKGFLGETLNVLSTLVLIPVALFNHVELVAELFGDQAYSTVTLRVGTGF